MTRSLTSVTGTPSSHLNGQGSNLKSGVLPREPTRTAGTGYGQVAAATRAREQVPAPDDRYPLFPNPAVAESLLDRLINSSHQVIMNGPRYRPNKRPKAPTDKPDTSPAARTRPS